MLHNEDPWISVRLFAQKKLNVYPFMHERASFVHDNRTFFQRPDFGYSPLAVALCYLSEDDDLQNMCACMEKMTARELVELTAALLWVHMESAYVYDASLLAELLKKPAPGHIPLDELMQLPEPYLYITAPVTVDGRQAHGFFSWLEFSFDKNKRANALLMFAFLMADETVSIRHYALQDGLDKAWSAPFQDVSARMADLMGEVRQALRRDISPLPKELWPLVHLVLYLDTDHADIHQAHLGCFDHSKENRFCGPKNICKVGYRIGNALRKYLNAKAGEWNTRLHAGHMPPQPHIRQAHWHAVWTGSKGCPDRCRVFRWMPYCLVGLKWEEEASDILKLLKPPKENG